MDVRDFVSSTIMQIMQAVADTQEAARELGGYVNPTMSSYSPESGAHIGTTAKGQAVYRIEYDIAVVVGSETGTEGGAKIEVASVLSIGGKGRGSDKTESSSRIRFAVPVTLPIDSASNEERAERARRASEAMARHNSTARSRGSSYVGKW